MRLATPYVRISFDVFKSAEPSDQRIGTNRQNKQHDKHRIHAWHVENAVGLNDQEANALVRKLGFGKQGADQGKTETQTHAVDDRMAHGGQVDLLDHLPGAGAEAVADADEDLIDLPHPGSDVE